MNNGKYYYERNRGMYRIYIRRDRLAEGEVCASTDECYRDRETARRRVYELNGWGVPKSDVGKPMSETENPKSDIEKSTSDVENPTSYIEN